MRSNVHSWQMFLHEICGNRGTATGGSRGVGSRVACIGLPQVRMCQHVQLSGGAEESRACQQMPNGNGTAARQYPSSASLSFGLLFYSLTFIGC